MRSHLLRAAVLTLLAAPVLPAADPAPTPLDPKVAAAEAKRVAVIEKVRPSVVAIFAPGGQGGGSGVLVTPDGYALTNFHVTDGCGPVMQCGLPDGVLYDAVIVGIDKVGDVALIKLLPKQPGQPFPFATLGDSDKLKAGDLSFAMGNPFLLATDFTPTVTFGLVSGVHRYPYPAGTLLEYTDCIQVDTSINPGNSGGPLFNAEGELVGINGRISIEKRGRVNSGVGYAISINQIKNFMGHLRAGLDVDHATLGARVQERGEEAATTAVLRFGTMLEDSDVHRRGVEPDDELVAFAGRPMASVNQYKNVLGLYPKGWRVPLTYRRAEKKSEVLVRLMGLQEKELVDPNAQKPPENQPRPRPQRKPPADSPAMKLYQAKDGFANLYFNKQERDRLLTAFRKHGDFTPVGGGWTIAAEGDVKGKRGIVVLAVSDIKDRDGKTIKPLSRGRMLGVEFELEPLKANQDPRALKDPPGSGGLLLALYHYRLLLTVGEKAFEGGFTHGGTEPLYPPPYDETNPEYAKRRVDCEVLRTEHAGVQGKWYFSQQDGRLLGFEVYSEEREDDPCEVYLSDYRAVDGRQLPHKLEVRYGNDRYAGLVVRNYELGKK